MRIRRRLALTAALALGLSLSACAKPAPQPTAPAGIDLGSAEAAAGNGLWLRSGEDLVAIVTGAMRAAGPVHVTGSVTETVQTSPDADPAPGRTVTIDYRGTSAAYTATVAAGDLRLEAVVSSTGTRLRGNAAFARLYPGTTPGAVTCTTGLDPRLSEWGPLLDPADLVRTLLDGRGVAAGAPDADAPADGADTIDVVTGEEGSVVGVLTVDRFGPPLPRTFVGGDASGQGSLAFEDWGEPVDLAAAAAALPCTEER